MTNRADRAACAQIGWTGWKRTIPACIAIGVAALIAATALIARAAAAAASNPVVAPAHYGRIGERMALYLPRKHVARLELNDAISKAAWTNYLSALDIERVYFLQDDITRFRTQAALLDDRLLDGDMDFAFEVFAVLKERVRDRCEAVDRLLEAGFDLTREETYRLRRRDAEWPADRAASDELWRKKIKNEYLQLLVPAELAAATTNAAGVTGTVAAVTNAVAAGAPPPPAGAVATNAASTNAASADAAFPELTPPEAIRKRYRQFLTLLTDSDAEWVLERYLSAFTRAFDPHSDYMSPSAIENFDIEMKLSLVGIGALLQSDDGAAKIVRLIPGGPADRDRGGSRLVPGDRIVAVADGNGPAVDVLHWPLNKIVRLIRGEKGTPVTLSVIPASDPTGSASKRVTLIRDEVRLEEQAVQASTRTARDAAGRERTLGVLKVPAFYANMRVSSAKDPEFRSSAADTARALDELKAKSVAGVLLDLRNNGGGSLLEAIRMTGLFIGAGPVVMVKERDTVRVIPDPDPTERYGGPLVVLVNRLSASASEILAGALQDYGRAVVVGDRNTHGKGSVQSIFELGSDTRLGSIKVTTAMYYRISGASTQLRGVQSDVVIASPFDRMEIGEEHLVNPMPWLRVEKAIYTPVADLSSVLPRLREEAARRAAGDERYRVYGDLLSRIEDLTRRREVPLDLVRRRQLAVAEREIGQLEKRLVAAADEPEDARDKAPDLVLEQALALLADYVDLCERAAPVAGDGPEPRTLTDRLADWMRMFLWKRALGDGGTHG